MVNALTLASRIHALVPEEESPENTEATKASIISPVLKAPLNVPTCTTSSVISTARCSETRKRKMMEIAVKSG